jgi:adenine specific DNA methylase Mod
LFSTQYSHYRGSYSKSLDYPITTPDGTEIYAGGKYGEPNTWRWSKDKFQWGLENSFILFKKTNNQWKVYLKQYQYVDNKGLLTTRKLPYRALTKFLNGTGSQELYNIMGNNNAFSFPKSVELVSYVINISNGDNSTILDFFGGSGTTAHATIELNKKDEGKRKYLLVELGSHFDTVIIPRLKKISFSDKWKDGKAQENGKGVSQFFKYFSLEQYEETLQKSRYIDTTNVLPDSGIYQEYLFLKDLKLADGVVNIDESQEKITVDLTALHPDIDIAETLSQLTGKFIKQITAETVVFADGTSMNFKNLDYRVIKPLIWW